MDMAEKTRAVVLRLIKYGDSQFIVDLLTESCGKLAFLVRLSKSSKGKMKRQYFQPMMLLEVEFDYRSGRALQKFINVGVAYPLAGVSLSLVKTTIALFLAEFLLYATRNEPANKPLFGFVFESMVWLDGSQGNIANFHLLFLLRLSLFLGLEPNLKGKTSYAYFDLQEGCFVKSVPSHFHFLSVADALHMVTMFRLNYKTMHLYTMSRKERNYCVEVMLDYYRLHIPDFPELKSLPVLQSLFS